MTAEALDKEPEVAGFGRRTCSNCGGSRLSLEDGICAPCLGVPVAKLPLPPVYLVVHPETLEMFRFGKEDAARKVAGWFGTDYREIGQ